MGRGIPEGDRATGEALAENGTGIPGMNGADGKRRVMFPRAVRVLGEALVYII